MSSPGYKPRSVKGITIELWSVKKDDACYLAICVIFLYLPQFAIFNHLHDDLAFLWNGSQFSCYIEHCVMLIDGLLLYMYQRVFASFTSSKRTGETAKRHLPLILLTCHAIVFHK